MIINEWFDKPQEKITEYPKIKNYHSLNKAIDQR